MIPSVPLRPPMAIPAPNTARPLLPVRVLVLVRRPLTLGMVEWGLGHSVPLPTAYPGRDSPPPPSLNE